MLIGLMLASDNLRNGSSYSEMVKACRATWADHRVISVYGNEHDKEKLASLPDNSCVYLDQTDEWEIPNKKILVNTAESRNNLLRKTVKAMEFCLQNFDFEYIFRPNCGSYINIDLLEKFLEEQPKSKYYNGIIGHYGHWNYASGSCFIMSKDVVEKIVRQQNELEYDGSKMIDDVAIGFFLTNNGINIHGGADRLDCGDMNELINSFRPDCYHYYFRSTVNPNLIYSCHKLFMRNQ